MTDMSLLDSIKNEKVISKTGVVFQHSQAELLKHLIGELQEVMPNTDEGAGQREIGLTTDGNLIITLHNKNERPTVYLAEFKFTHASSYPQKVTVDTLSYSKTNNHRSLKKSEIYIAPLTCMLKELLVQLCSGTKENTLENYIPMGLFYQDKKTTQEKFEPAQPSSASSLKPRI